MIARLAKLVNRISRQRTVLAGGIHRALAQVEAASARIVSRDDLPVEESERRAALKKARRALRRAERARASRLRRLRWAVRRSERDHGRRVGRARAALARAESDSRRRVEEARKRLESVRAALGSVELARFDSLVLYEDRLVTPRGEVRITQGLRALVGTGSGLALARPTAFARLEAQGLIDAQAFRAGRGREARKLYLLVEAPELVSSVPCQERDEPAASAFAARVNVSALNAPMLARRRKAALAEARKELERAADRSAAGRAQEELAWAEADTSALDAARSALAKAEADSAEVEELRVQVELLGVPIPVPASLGPEAGARKPKAPAGERLDKRPDGP